MPSFPPLTIDPGNADGLKDGHEKEAHATGRVVVKELENVHATLQEEAQNCSQSEGLRMSLQTIHASSCAEVDCVGTCQTSVLAKCNPSPQQRTQGLSAFHQMHDMLNKQPRYTVYLECRNKLLCVYCGAFCVSAVKERSLN